MGIQRRPYHRNCNCALHKSRGGCSHPPKNTQVSYPVKRSWSDNCLALMAASGSGHSPSVSVTSPAMGTSPTGEIPRTKSQLALSNLEQVKSSGSGHSPSVSVTSLAMGTSPTREIPRTKSQLALSNLEQEKNWSSNNWKERQDFEASFEVLRNSKAEFLLWF